MFISKSKQTKKRILFIVKKRTLPYYDQCGEKTVSSGLTNSARFIVDMLNQTGNYVASLAEAIDNNCLDKLVYEFNADIVIIEALWVVPEKFKILHDLHPNVKWIIRLHSDIPFLAHEGIAFDWLNSYTNYNNVFIAANSHRIVNDLDHLLGNKNFYLPNYYPLPDKIPHYNDLEFGSKEIDIGCFGAIRPFKNILIQAISAIKFADNQKLKLNFHINANRLEDNGEPNLKNLRALFKNSKHVLVEHPWLSHDEFLNLIGSMHINMQVSFSETFNIVTADSVAMNVPVVVSPEIFWINNLFKANPNDSNDIVDVLTRTFYLSKLGIHRLNFLNLNSYNKSVIKYWKF